jgi:uncharacterized protein YjiS (DUF1127 family)
MAVEYRNIFDELDARGVFSSQEIELRARLARAEMFADLFIAVGRMVRALAGRAVARWRDAGARAELAAMTDRELADIGLTRGDIHRKNLGEIARETPVRAAPTAVPANRNDLPRRAA